MCSRPVQDYILWKAWIDFKDHFKKKKKKKKKGEYRDPSWILITALCSVLSLSLSLSLFLSPITLEIYYSMQYFFMYFTVRNDWKVTIMVKAIPLE